MVFGQWRILHILLGVSIFGACGLASADTPSNVTAIHPAPPSTADPLTLAVRVISYRRKDGRPVLSQKQANSVLDEVNRIYGGCRIRMRLEEFRVVDPKKHGLDEN